MLVVDQQNIRTKKRLPLLNSGDMPYNWSPFQNWSSMHNQGLLLYRRRLCLGKRHGGSLRSLVSGKTLPK